MVSEFLPGILSVGKLPGAGKKRVEKRRKDAILVQVADRSAAARMFEIAWRTVGRIVRRVVDRFLPDDLLEGIEFIGVDETSDEGKARGFMMRWTRGALPSRRELLRKFAKTVREHLDGILGFMRWETVTNANLEGMANKIKLYIHKAFGFHSVDALIGMIHLCCSGIELD